MSSGYVHPDDREPAPESPPPLWAEREATKVLPGHLWPYSEEGQVIERVLPEPIQIRERPKIEVTGPYRFFLGVDQRTGEEFWRLIDFLPIVRCRVNRRTGVAELPPINRTLTVPEEDLQDPTRWPVANEIWYEPEDLRVTMGRGEE